MEGGREGEGRGEMEREERGERETVAVNFRTPSLLI